MQPPQAIPVQPAHHDTGGGAQCIQEEQLYQAEGVPYDHVPFIDNQPVLNLIESRPSGIFALLDDEVVIGPKGNDEGFMRSMLTQHKHATLIRVFVGKASCLPPPTHNSHLTLPPRDASG